MTTWKFWQILTWQNPSTFTVSVLIHRVAAAPFAWPQVTPVWLAMPTTAETCVMCDMLDIVHQIRTWRKINNFIRIASEYKGLVMLPFSFECKGSNNESGKRGKDVKRVCETMRMTNGNSGWDRKGHKKEVSEWGRAQKMFTGRYINWRSQNDTSNRLRWHSTWEARNNQRLSWNWKDERRTGQIDSEWVGTVIKRAARAWKVLTR